METYGVVVGDLIFKEYEILTHLARGTQPNEIGKEMNMHPISINSSLKRIRKKLHVETNEQAIEIAAQRGWVKVLTTA